MTHKVYMADKLSIYASDVLKAIIDEFLQKIFVSSE